MYGAATTWIVRVVGERMGQWGKAAAVVAVAVWVFSACATTPPVPVVEAAPPPPPPPPLELVLPLVGDPHAVDDDGYPTAYIDRVKLHAMLRERRFVELTAAFEAAQREFERDWHHEYWAHDTVEAFTTDPAFEELFAAWIAATPTSFAPWAARGAWWSDRAAHARGTRYASDTPTEQFRRMDEMNNHAVADLTKALAMRPRAVSVSRVLVIVGKYSSDVVDVDRVTSEALAACPNCLHIRVAVMVGLAPRWGGSYEAMDAFATAALVGTTNPRLRVLQGYLDEDQADFVDDPAEKLRLLDAAIAHGEASDFFRHRARVRKNRDRDGALADLRKVVELRPAVGLNHATLAVALVEHGDWRDAEAEMRLALALDGSDIAPSFLPSFRQAIRVKARNPHASQELLDLALAFEDDPRRVADFKQRREGRTSLVVAVDEPPAWATAVPPPKELVTLLTSDDGMLRNAAWCRLLEQALQQRNDQRLWSLRCRVNRVERAVARDGTPLVVVAAAASEAGGSAPTLVVHAGGALTLPGFGVTLRDRHSDVVGVAGTPERKAIVSYTSASRGPGPMNVVLVAQIVDTVPQPVLHVVLGGPVPRSIDHNDRGATLPLTWRMQTDRKTRRPALELVTRDTVPKVVARYTWDDVKSVWKGPAGSPGEGFKRIEDGAPDAVQREIDAWNAALGVTSSSASEEPTR